MAAITIVERNAVPFDEKLNPVIAAKSVDGVGVHVRRRGVQPGANAESAGQPGWCRMSRGRSVSARGESGQNKPADTTTYSFQMHLGVVCPLSGIMRVTDVFTNSRFFRSLLVLLGHKKSLDLLSRSWAYPEEV
jgi:hypothetical protein